MEALISLISTGIYPHLGCRVLGSFGYSYTICTGPPEEKGNGAVPLH